MKTNCSKKTAKIHLWLLAVGLTAMTIMLTGCVVHQEKQANPKPPATTAASATTATEPAVLEKDKPAPDFELEDLNGKKVKLSDYKGKYVLVNFWATWCKFCQKEIPDLIAFDQANDDIVVLAVDYMESPDTVKGFLKQKKFKMNTLLDQDGKIGSVYAITSFPTTYVIDQKGNLVGGIQGMTNKEELQSLKKFLHDKYPK